MHHGGRGVKGDQTVKETTEWIGSMIHTTGQVGVNKLAEVLDIVLDGPSNWETSHRKR